MLTPKFTTNILDQGCALVQAIHSVEAMDTSDPFEREVSKLMRAAFERRVLDLADNVSSWEIDEILRLRA